MKLYFTTILIFCFVSIHSQSKWETSIDLDFVFPNKKDYFYNDSNNRIKEAEIKDDGFLLNSFGIQASYNYFLFKKISLGILSGIQTQSNPKLLLLKLGGVLKFYFVDRDNVYIYLQDANNFTLNKENFKSGNNLRLGLGFPIKKRDSFDIIGNLFFEQNYFKLDGSKSLLNLTDEIPRSLTVKSFGISVGIKF